MEEDIDLFGPEDDTAVLTSTPNSTQDEDYDPVNCCYERICPSTLSVCPLVDGGNTFAFGLLGAMLCIRPCFFSYFLIFHLGFCLLYTTRG